MKRKSDFNSEMKNLLSLEASDEEKEYLEGAGITLKNPTKQTMLLAALYEKAKKGDLSAMKEILGRTTEFSETGGGVVLIDDIKDTN